MIDWLIILDIVWYAIMENQATICNALEWSEMLWFLYLIFYPLFSLSLSLSFFSCLHDRLTGTVNTLLPCNKDQQTHQSFSFCFSPLFTTTWCFQLSVNPSVYQCFYMLTHFHFLSLIGDLSYLLTALIPFEIKGLRASLNNLTNMHSKKWHAPKTIHVQAQGCSLFTFIAECI